MITTVVLLLHCNKHNKTNLLRKHLIVECNHNSQVVKIQVCLSHEPDEKGWVRMGVNIYIGNIKRNKKF